MALQELDLEVVQGVQVREAVPDRAGERGVRLEERAGAGDLEERAARRLELAADASEDPVRGRRVARELLVARGDGEVRLREQHVQVREHAAEEEPLARHAG